MATYRRHRQAARAFTLIEILVGVAVIGVLLAIVLVAIARTREISRGAVNKANMRSTHQEFWAWGQDRQNTFVNLGGPAGGGDIQIPLPGGGWVVTSYSLQTRYWPGILASDLGVGMQDRWRSVYRGSQEHDEVPLSQPGDAFLYSLPMLLDWKYFAGGDCQFGAPAGPFIRKVRWDETVYPAAKGLLLDELGDPSAEEPRFDCAFVDGSVASVTNAQSDIPPGRRVTSDRSSGRPTAFAASTSEDREPQ